MSSRPAHIARARCGHALVECLVALTLIGVAGAAMLTFSAASLSLHDAAEQAAVADDVVAREAARLLAAHCGLAGAALATGTPRQILQALSTDHGTYAGRRLESTWTAAGVGRHAMRRWELSIGVPCG